MSLRKIKKPQLESMLYLDFFELKDWCLEKFKVDINDLLADLEAGNDSYCYTTLEELEVGHRAEYGPRLEKILREEFGVVDKIAFWVCW